MDGNLESFYSFLYENYFILGHEMWFNITFFLTKTSLWHFINNSLSNTKKKKWYIWDIFTVTPLKGKTWTSISIANTTNITYKSGVKFFDQFSLFFLSVSGVNYLLVRFLIKTFFFILLKKVKFFIEITNEKKIKFVSNSVSKC